MASPASSYYDISSDNRRGTILLGAALLLTTVSYLAALYFGFVYDDGAQIISNPTLNSWSTLPKLFTEHSWKFLIPDLVTNYYRPLFMSWLLVNRKLFGLHEPAFHATSLLIHLVVTWLTFIVARQLLRNATNAGFVAILFGLHPIHVEAVAWVSGVTEPLMTAFVLAAVWAWIRAEREFAKATFFRVLAAAFYAAGCLCKETALLLPIVIVGHDMLRGQHDRNLKGLVQAAARALPLWITALGYLALRAYVLRGLMHPVNVAWSHIFLTVPTIFWGYMRRLVWPVHQSVFYATPPVTSPGDIRFWLPSLCILLAGILLWRIGRRSRLTGFAFVWMFVFLAPAFIGLPAFIRGEWMHDRYLYLPSFGFCLLVVYAISQIPSKRELFHLPAVPLLTVLTLAVLMVFAIGIEELPWHDDFHLYMHAVAVQPESPQAQAHLATEFFRRGDVAAAEQHYAMSLALSPFDWKNITTYGLMLYYSGQFREADRELQGAIALQPRDSNLYFYQGLCRFNLQNYPAAENAFQQAIRVGPRLPRYHFWLGFALEKEGRLNEARAEYEQELLQHPDTDTQVRQRLEEISSRSPN